MTRTRITTDGITDASVTYAKVQNVAADRVLGRASTSGVVTEIVCTAAGRALIDDANAATQRATLGLGAIIDVGGNVGIGTVNPTTRLDVRRTNSYAIFCDSAYTTAEFGPREVNDGFCSVRFSWAAYGTGNNWGIDCGASVMTWAQTVNNVRKELMTVTGTGNVGIGTVSPQNRLDVVGNEARTCARGSTTTDRVFIEAQASDYWSATSYIGTSLRQHGSGATGTSAGLANASLGSLYFQNCSNALIATNGSSLIFAPSEVERMRITTTGNVGIGTASPAVNLHVVDAAAPDIRVSGAGPSLDVFTDTTTGYVGTTTNHPLVLRTNNVDRWRMDTNGQVTSVIPGGTTLLPGFMCRVWVNFNGQGTPAIRASGNVSSVSRVATGDYMVNFATAMPDTNFAATGSCLGINGVTFGGRLECVPWATSQVRVLSVNSPGSAAYDSGGVQVAVFR